MTKRRIVAETIRSVKWNEIQNIMYESDILLLVR